MRNPHDALRRWKMFVGGYADDAFHCRRPREGAPSTPPVQFEGEGEVAAVIYFDHETGKIEFRPPENPNNTYSQAETYKK